MTPYPAICEGCHEAATCINVRKQQVYKVCCASEDKRRPCHEMKVCPTTGLFIKNIIKVGG